MNGHGLDQSPCYTKGDVIETALTTAKFIGEQARNLIDLAALLDTRTEERDSLDRRLCELHERYTRILALAQGDKPRPRGDSFYLRPTNTAAEEMHPDVKIIFDLRQRTEQCQLQLTGERQEIARLNEQNTSLRALLSKALTLKDRYWNALKRMRASGKAKKR